jgi:cytochrome c oxidase subunit IV
MSHEHEYVSNTGKIWKVFGILSLVTIIEVILGILKPESLHFTDFMGMNLLNWILCLQFIRLIICLFMHMEGEKSALRYAVVLPVIFLIMYLLFILLTEGNYIYEVLKLRRLSGILTIY